MKLTDLLQGIGSPIAFYPDIVPIAGSQNAAIFLCQLTYWHGKQRNPNGWIYKTQEEWFIETSLTDKQQRSARDLLVERGFIEERYRGIPRRLEYRLREDGFNDIWDIWMIAINLKKDYRALLNEHGVNSSRGIPIEEMQDQIILLRAGMHEAYTTIDNFFEQCREDKRNPFDLLHKLKSSLSKIAETIEKSITAHLGELARRFNKVRTLPKRDTGKSLTDELVGSYRRFGAASNPDAVSRPDPSKNTPKTTSETSPKNTQKAPEPDFFYKGTNTQNLDLQEKVQEEIKKVTFQISQEPDQLKEDQEIGSQAKTNPLIKVNIPSGENDSQNHITENIGAKNNTITPCVVMLESGAENDSWVEELEEIVRNGDPLPRSELYRLAEYRLGEYVHLYRESGVVLSAAANDFNPEFLKFVQWYSFNGDPNITFVIKCVKKYERDPEEWDVLLSWLQAFQEVQANPEHLETILSQKVASQGKNVNKRDLDALNHININKAFTDKEWWDSL